MKIIPQTRGAAVLELGESFSLNIGDPLLYSGKVFRNLYERLATIADFALAFSADGLRQIQKKPDANTGTSSYCEPCDTGNVCPSTQTEGCPE